MVNKPVQELGKLSLVNQIQAIRFLKSTMPLWNEEDDSRMKTTVMKLINIISILLTSQHHDHKDIGNIRR